MFDLPLLDRRPNRRMITAGAGLALAALLVPSVCGQDAKPGAAPPTTKPAATAKPVAKDLPPAADIIKRALGTLGDSKEVAAIKNVKYTVTMTGPQGPVALDIRSTSKNRVLVSAETPQGSGEMARNGDIGWSRNGGAYALLAPEEVGQVGDVDFFGFILGLGHLAKKSETVDRVEFDGAECCKVRLGPEAEDAAFGYFDTADGHLRGVERTRATPMGNIPMTSTFSEYKEFDPVRMFTRVTVSVFGQTMTMDISDVEYDTLEEGAFAVPGEIATLVAERKAAAATQPASPPTSQPASGAGG